MAATTLELTRRGRIFARRQTWQVLIDGSPAGPVGNGEEVSLPVEPRQHTLRLRASRRFASRERSFQAAAGEAVYFTCSAPLVWPHALASLIVPSLWIGLRQRSDR